MRCFNFDEVQYIFFVDCAFGVWEIEVWPKLEMYLVFSYNSF